MKPLEQKEFKANVAKSSEDGAFIVARWQTENSQWKYSRYERGLEEMTGGGEAWTNLFTWSKSMFQHVGMMSSRFVDASKRYVYANDPYAKRAATRQMLHSASDVAGIMLAGSVANLIYEAVSVSHGARFQPYGADMFTWQMGGVTAEILTTFTQKSADLVSAYSSGDDAAKNRALTDWIKMTDNVGIRQLIPFAKQTLSMIESLTDRSYLSPLYTVTGKLQSGYWRGLAKVDRTFLEGITHAIWAVDPNKSEAVRKYTFAKLNDLESRAAVATGAMKNYYDLQVARYRYLSDLFMRYRPIDVYKESLQKERRDWTDQQIQKMQNRAYQQEKKRYE